MKIQFVTQFRENYGSHDWNGEGECPQYWKNKGGDTYILNNVSVEEASSDEVYSQMENLLTHVDDYSSEVVIDTIILDECDNPKCPEWETPYDVYRNDDGTFTACRSILNDEYGYFRRDIVSKYEDFTMLPNGKRENYRCNYLMNDGYTISEEELSNREVA